jgi:hypothetical protein
MGNLLLYFREIPGLCLWVGEIFHFPAQNFVPLEDQEHFFELEKGKSTVSIAQSAFSNEFFMDQE